MRRRFLSAFQLVPQLCSLCRVYVARRFKKPLMKHELPNLRLYDLRHTAATLRLATGEHPKIVAEMLGHASITMTLDTYSHVLPDMQAESAERMERLLFWRQQVD